eukprot:12915406-Prorocentrum_lima.AAC.1
MLQCPAPRGDRSSGQTPSGAVRTACDAQLKCWRTPPACSNSRWPFPRPAQSCLAPLMSRHHWGGQTGHCVEQ